MSNLISMPYIHNLDPFAIQFTEHFGIRWYGLAYLAGFICGYYAIVLMAKRGRTQFKVDQVADFITYVAIGVLVGGRLGYCLFYAPELFTSFDGHFPYWGVLKVNEGGMASHGGIMGVMFVCWAYARYHKISFLHCLDLTVFGGALGFFFGRIANFINGELYGREAAAGFAWAVKFPSEMTLWVQRHFERLSDLKPAVDALGELKTGSETIPLNSTIWQGWLDGFGRDSLMRQHVYETIDALILAVQNGNAKVTEALGPVLTPRYPSQLYQAVLEGLLVFLILCWLWRKPQKPGVIGGWFGVLYCIARIVGEQFRMPDAQIGFQLLGLTRGQWLSIGFLAFALGYLIVAYRRNVPKMGGWFVDSVR
ncbi:MAG: prolipoprotein diacylglyceryl transferase [Bdellovibrionales bacterium]|nr:prolipoprotein diacylglyceryl transferase [Bdellovibrionales bacterium]